MGIVIETFFDKLTATFTYVVSDTVSKQAAVIDSVLNYDQDAGRTRTISADEVIAYLKSQNLTVTWLLETHIHADHLSAAHYLRDKVGGQICIGSRIKDVLSFWVPLFNSAHDTALDASQFDLLLDDNDVIKLGDIDIKIMHTPGHTPACVCYVIEDAIFVGDTVFMPDVGTARTDFPGGSAETQYDSLRRILSLPDETRIFTCHDYPTEGRAVAGLSTVAEQKKKNILINDKVTKDEYVQVRNNRDHGKAVPKLLLPSIQYNMRAGSFGDAEDNGVNYIKIPVNRI